MLCQTIIRAGWEYQVIFNNFLDLICVNLIFDLSHIDTTKILWDSGRRLERSVNFLINECFTMLPNFLKSVGAVGNFSVVKNFSLQYPIAVPTIISKLYINLL